MLSTDLKAYEPANVTDTPAHGGRISANLITSGAPNNIWADITSEERAAGKIKYEKIFLKVADDADGKLQVARAYFNALPAGDNWATFFDGTATDTLADIPGADTGADAKTKYGIAPVTTNVVAGTRTIKVTVPSVKLLSTGADEIYRVGETIIIGKTGTQEVHTISALAELGMEITITTAADIANNYATTDTPWVASVKSLGTVETSSAVVGHTGGADYDAATYAPVLDNIGTVRQRLVFTFGDSINFTCVGDSLAGLGSGTVNADFTAMNTALSKPLCTLLAGGWTGLTIAANDTFTLDIFGADPPVWEKYEVPAGAEAVSEDLRLHFSGEVA